MRNDAGASAGRAGSRVRMETASCQRQNRDRRAAIAACGAFALVAAIGSKAARAQSGLPVRNIRVDVAPLRANAGDPTATWVEQALSRRLAQALAAPPHAERRDADREDRLSYVGIEHRGHHPRRLLAGQHPGRSDARRRAMAGAGDEPAIWRRRSTRRWSNNPTIIASLRSPKRWPSGSRGISGVSRADCQLQRLRRRHFAWVLFRFIWKEFPLWLNLRPRGALRASLSGAAARWRRMRSPGPRGW